MPGTSIVGVAEVTEGSPQLQGHFEGSVPAYMQGFRSSASDVLTLDAKTSGVQMCPTAAGDQVVFASPSGTYPAGEEMTFTMTARVLTRDAAVLHRWGAVSSDMRDGVYSEVTAGPDGAKIDRLVFRSASFSSRDMLAFAEAFGGEQRTEPTGIDTQECVIPKSAWGAAMTKAGAFDPENGVVSQFRVLWFGTIGVQAQNLFFGGGPRLLKAFDMKDFPVPFWRVPNQHVFWQTAAIGDPAGPAELRAICFKYVTPQTRKPAHRRKSIRVRRTAGFAAAGLETHLMTVRLKPNLCRQFRSFNTRTVYTASGPSGAGLIRTYRNAVLGGGPTFANSKSDSILEWDDVATTVTSGVSPIGFTWTPNELGAFVENQARDVEITNEETFGCLLNGTAQPDRETLTFTFEALTGTPTAVDLTVEFEEF